MSTGKRLALFRSDRRLLAYLLGHRLNLLLHLLSTEREEIDSMLQGAQFGFVSFTFCLKHHVLNFQLGLSGLKLPILREEAAQVDVLELRLNGGGFAFAARIVRADRGEREG